MSSSKKRAIRSVRNAISSIVEMLEKRQMLTVVPLTGAPGNDNFTIGLNQATQQYIFGGGLNPPAPAAVAAVTGFTLTGGGANASLAVLSGSPTMLNDAGGDGTSLSVTVDSGASLSFNTTEHLASLTVDASATARMLGTHQVLDTSGLTLSGSAGAWTGTMDLGSSDMIVHGGNIATLTSQIASGYNGGNWNGSGIQSSGAASDPTHLTALGIIANNTGGSTPLYTNFDSQTVVSTDVLVKTTIYGDANLDGQVDGTDYSRIDNGYLDHLTGWGNGDFNYDGVIDGSDYTLIDNAFNTQPGTPTPTIRLSGASTVEPGSPYTLNFSVVADQSPSSFSINWGDGSNSTAAGSATSATHTYALGGTYRVSVTAMIGGTAYTSDAFGLDSSFGQDGIVSTSTPLTGADAMVQAPDGDTVVLDASNGLLEAFNSNGEVDTSFGSEGITQLGLQTVAKALAVDQSGDLLVTGLDSGGNLVVERITPAGIADTTFGPDGNALVLSDAPTGILAGGVSLLDVPTSSTSSEVVLAVANDGAFEVARILSDGTLDPNAGSGGIFTGPNVSLSTAANVSGAIAADGSLVLAGRTAAGSVLEQFNKSGGADVLFNSGSPLTLANSVTSLAVDGSGNIFIGTVSGSDLSYIDSLQANGSSNTAFGAGGVVQLPVGSITGGISSFAVDGNNNIFAIGSNGAGVEAAKYESDGTLDSTFGSDGLFAISLSAAGYADSASDAVLSDGQLVIAASLIDGVNSNGEVVRVNADNQVSVQLSLQLVPDQMPSAIYAGDNVVFTAEGDAVSGSDELDWSEYANGQLVLSNGVPIADDGTSYTFTPPDPGQYVIDVAASGAEAEYTFTVLPNPPFASISGPASANPNSVVVLIGTASHDPSQAAEDNTVNGIGAQLGPAETVSATLSYS